MLEFCRKVKEFSHISKWQKKIPTGESGGDGLGIPRASKKLDARE